MDMKFGVDKQKVHKGSPRGDETQRKTRSDNRLCRTQGRTRASGGGGTLPILTPSLRSPCWGTLPLQRRTIRNTVGRNDRSKTSPPGCQEPQRGWEIPEEQGPMSHLTQTALKETRTCHPWKVPLWHMAYFEFNSLETQQLQEGYSDPSFLRESKRSNSRVKGTCPGTRKKTDILHHQRQGEGTGRIRVWTIHVNKPSSTSPCLPGDVSHRGPTGPPAPCPNPFVFSMLHKLADALSLFSREGTPVPAM